MTELAIPFFNPADVLSLSGDDWVQQENNITETAQRAQGLDADGNEAANKRHGVTEAGTVVYECHLETGDLTLPKVGIVVGGYHLDNFVVAYNPTGWPRLTASVHNHGANAHAADLRTFTPTLTLPAQFGVPRTLGEESFALTAADCGVAGMSYSCGCTHVDEDENGDHIAGQNRDGDERLTWEFTGVPTVTPKADWDEMSDGNVKSNTAAEKSSMSWEHHITHDVPEE